MRAQAGYDEWPQALTILQNLATLKHTKAQKQATLCELTCKGTMPGPLETVKRVQSSDFKGEKSKSNVTLLPGNAEASAPQYSVERS